MIIEDRGREGVGADTAKLVTPAGTIILRVVSYIIPAAAAEHINRRINILLYRYQHTCTSSLLGL